MYKRVLECLPSLFLSTKITGDVIYLNLGISMIILHLHKILAETTLKAKFNDNCTAVKSLNIQISEIF